MGAYRRILAAIDLSEESRAVSARACELARTADGVVKLLHVIEFVPIEPMSDSLVPVVQIDDQMLSRARRQLEELAAELGLPADAGSVETGNAKSEILRYVREQHIDLIVIGCRERHGLSLLVHRTEDSVLHAAPCDVLAVRVGEPAAALARHRTTSSQT
ncbi:MAG TPA: universal stress protein [Steroidobacteraceae bacterium]|jgi:universal stress protein A|nr:universal stress protein [Steroidobacteraceae bacterium]